MTRRILLATLAIALLVACTPARDSREVPPNIVLILADDLGYGDVGAYSSESRIATPHIDALAREGIRMLDAHSPAPICSPSRYALLTGREPFRAGRVSNALKPLSPPALRDARLTLPELLRGAGYTTALVGKWHLGRRYTLLESLPSHELAAIDWSQPLVNGPMQHGFDHFFGLALPGWTFLEDGLALEPPSEAFDLSDLPDEVTGRHPFTGYRAPGFRFDAVLDRLTQYAVGFIERRARTGEPFFLQFAPAVPHTPYLPGDSHRGRSQVGAYGDVVEELDDSVGRILDALERSDVAERTLVVFTSDNGPDENAYERLRRHDHASMGALRGVKHTRWEGGHRVPFIARWPGHVAAGSTSDETISLVDLMATFASAAGAAIPRDAAEDSHDILPALLGAETGSAIREATFVSRGRRIATRSGSWVLIEMPEGDLRSEPSWFRTRRGIEAGPGEVSLFDLATDPGQAHDVAAEHPERVEALVALRKRLARSARTAP